MAELKPCPFCGCDDIRVITTTEQCVVCCSKCHANISRMTFKVCGSLAEAKRDSQPKAIKAWNRRVPQTEVHQYGENCTHISNCGTLNLNL